jgi:ribosomal protein S1
MSDQRNSGRRTLSDGEWEAVKRRFPIGTVVTVRVAAAPRFGIFVDLDGGALGIIDIATMKISPDAAKLPLDHDAWPKPGENVTGRVIWYRDYNQEIDLEWLPQPWRARPGPAAG